MELFGNPKQKKEITSFQSVLLSTSGMRGTTEEELRMKDGMAEIARYRIRYAGEKQERVLEKHTFSDEAEVLKLLNDCDLLSWDGFKGPHPKHVQDGIMFTLNAVVNGDQKITASGSENFPKHYREFTDGLYHLLNGQE